MQEPLLITNLIAEAERRRSATTELQKEEKRLRDAAQFQNKFNAYFPDTGPLRRELYPKQIQFFESGLKYRERAAIMGNRVGKTDAGAYELTCHLTGEYPEWWTGKRFDRPIRAWAAGDSNGTVRDIIQPKLLGRIVRSEEDGDSAFGLGTGMIPGAKIKSTRPRSGIPNAIEIVYVAHKSGGTSQLTLKSYEQGRKAFQGTEIEVIWLDEECPEDVYTECLLRTMTCGGIVFLTFTPLMGLTPLIMKFLPGGKMPDKGWQIAEGERFVITAGWDDAPHLTAEVKAELWGKLPPHQREARTKGVPQLGAGAIYPVPESDIVVQPIEIPLTWKHCYALDVGWNRTAVVWLAEDPKSHVWYAFSEHYVAHAEPSVHAQAIRARGEWIPGVIDPAARGRSQHDGQRMIENYRDLGLNLQPAKNAVESGLYEVWQMLSGGMLKVFAQLQNLLEEYRLYRRDENGHVVKEKDHLMDALRYAVLSGRDIAKAKMIKPKTAPNPFGHRGDDWMAS